MSSGLNKVYLLGHLGRDPELKITTNSAVLKFSMATAESFLKDQKWQERTEWHQIDVWGKRAEALSKILAKGDKVCVEGSLRTHMWETRSGEKRYSTAVNASNIILCGNKKDQGAPATSSDASKGDAYEPPYTADMSADDMPF